MICLYKIMKKLLIAFCLLYSSLGFSQNWYKILENGEDYIEVDLESIVRNNTIVCVWEKGTYKDEKRRREKIDSELSFLRKYDYNSGIPKEVILKWANFTHTLTCAEYDLPA